MPKIVGFLRRRPDLSYADFSVYWRTVHRAHAERLRPWLKGYVQAHYRTGPFPDVQRPTDGSPLLWIDDFADMAALAASPECCDGATADEPMFMEGRSSGLAVEEVVTMPRSGPAAVKLMLFAHSRPDATRAALEGASGWLCPVTHACGRTVDHAVAGQTIDPAFAFDAIEEIWWPDETAFRRDWAAVRTIESVPWLLPAGFKAAFVDEIEVFAPPH